MEKCGMGVLVLISFGCFNLFVEDSRDVFFMEYGVFEWVVAAMA